MSSIIITKIKEDEKQVREYYNTSKFNVLFWGRWQRLHGLDVVAKAIVLLKPHKQVFFTLMGSHNDNDIRQKAEYYLEENEADNYRFIESQPTKKFIEYIRCCDLALAGAYANNEKAKIVVRNATTEAMALKQFILVPDTPANRELLEDNVSCLMCKLGDPKSLAQRILDGVGWEEKLKA